MSALSATMLIGIGLLFSAGAGFVLGRAGQPSARGAAGGTGLVSVARHLMLGRIARSMTHELSQSLNVITMANGNLSYILDGLALKPELKEQISSRVRRIATHCDTAAMIITHFKWFGQDNNRDKGVLTVGTAIDRAIEATRADFRPTGITIECTGGALDLSAVERHGTIEMIVTLLLFAIRRALVGDPLGEETPSAQIDIDAALSGGDLVISLRSDAPREKSLRHAEGVDTVNVELAADIAADRGGTVDVGREGNQWFVVRFDRNLL